MNCSECGACMERPNRYELCRSCRMARRCSECGGIIGWKSTSGICNSCAASDRFKKMNEDGGFRRKISGANHYYWTGDSATYGGRHQRTVKTRGKASLYECFALCGRKAAQWAQIHNTSGMDPIHYVPVCHSCHLRYDQSGVMFP